MKYWAIFCLSVREGLRNWKLLVGLSIFLMACLVIFANLWKVVGWKSFGEAELLWYIAFNQWLLCSVPHVFEDIEEDLKSGRLAYLLVRPVSYLGAVFAEAMGTLCVNLAVLGAVAFGYTMWQVGMPFSVGELAVGVGLGLFAGVVLVVVLMMIGLFAFWLHDVSPVFWIWDKSLFMLGGLLMPLVGYPVWLQRIAAWTPFPPILGGRSGIALGIGDGWSIAMQLLVWLGIGVVGLMVVYRKSLKILNIEGG